MCEPLHTACDFTLGRVGRQLPPVLEDGRITADNFRDFTFANAVRLWGTQNPRFFEGTRVAKEPAAVLAAAQTRPSRLTVELLWRAPLGNSGHSPIARLTSGGAAKRGRAVKFISRTETRVALRR